MWKVIVSQKKRGFTLIELLVVIAIISLLVSILLPSLKMAKEAANRSVCMSNMHQLCTAMLLYAEDYRGLLPPFTTKDETDKIVPTTSFARYAGCNSRKSGIGCMLGPHPYWMPSEYISNLDMLFCPGDFLYAPERYEGVGLGPGELGDGRSYYTGYLYIYICRAEHEDRTHQWFGMGRFSNQCDPVRIIGMEHPHFNPPHWHTNDGPFWHLNGRNYLRLDGSVFFISEAELESKFDVYRSAWKPYLLFLEE